MVFAVCVLSFGGCGVLFAAECYMNVWCLWCIRYDLVCFFVVCCLLFAMCGSLFVVRCLCVVY